MNILVIHIIWTLNGRKGASEVGIKTWKSSPNVFKKGLKTFVPDYTYLTQPYTTLQNLNTNLVLYCLSFCHLFVRIDWAVSVHMKCYFGCWKDRINWVWTTAQNISSIQVRYGQNKVLNTHNRTIQTCKNTRDPGHEAFDCSNWHTIFFILQHVYYFFHLKWKAHQIKANKLINKHHNPIG